MRRLSPALPSRSSTLAWTAVTCALLLAPSALAQDPVPPSPPPLAVPPPPTTPPDVRGAGKVSINFQDADLYTLMEYFGRATGQNFIISDKKELDSKKVTIIANKPVSAAAAYEAFMSALEVHGLTIVKVGELHKIIKADQAQKSPGKPGEGGAIKQTDQYITQIIPFENVSVKDVREIVDNLVSPNAKVLAYAPANTLILTDTGYNIKRIYDIVSQLDVSAPKSTLQIYQIVYADASDIKSLIEELYGTAEESEPAADPRQAAAARRRRRRAAADEPASEGVTAGEASNYISKVISDERTNALIAIANDQGHEAIRDLIGKIDIDVDPASRSQIYVYRLEHAKAEDIASVLSDLAGGGSSKGAGNQSAVDTRAAARRAAATGAEAPAAGGAEAGGAVAAFDSGTRIAADDNTNSLVIIASKDDYEVIASVIAELDVKRKQVFVDAVILELSSTDTLDLNLGYHAPLANNPDGTVGIGSAGFGLSTPLGLSTDLLTGLAFGVFGKTVDVPVSGAQGPTTLAVPAFGVALQALKTNQMVNIVSTPSVLALDNEEAKIVVGRKIPFPTSNAFNNLGQPVISFQRQDVAITMEMTPRINSENMVTLELNVEVQDVEQSDQSQVANAGPTTSNRQIETVALVGDNQTVVLGGLVASTDSSSETKIPILGDIPILGALFRGRNKTARRTNLLVFLTPHIIDSDEDFAEIMRVKEAQRAEFLRRFYGKSQDEQFEEIRRLLQYSMNSVDRPSVYRGPTTIASTVTLDGDRVSAASREELRGVIEQGVRGSPGADADRLTDDKVRVEVPAPEASADPEPGDDDGDEQPPPNPDEAATEPASDNEPDDVEIRVFPSP